MDSVVDIQHVSKRYGSFTAVDDLSLTIPRGAVYGLLGPNGAGKTTTIRMIMNIILPDDGKIALFGGEAPGQHLTSRIGYLPEERGLYKKMHVDDLLVFLAQIKGLDRTTARRRAGEWLDRLELAGWARKKVDDLSKGMQQKVQFIATMLHEPEFLILDEPFSGLDPVNSQIMKDIVVDLARGETTILFSTHIMEQAERLCDSVCIIARGRIVVNGRLADVKREHGGRNVIVAVEQGGSAVDRVLNDPALVANTNNSGNYAEIELADGADPQDLLKGLIQAGARVTKFELAEPTLNQIFIDKVGGQAAPGRPEEVHAHA
jgi:ABC-2 type transport system ATP-binding protein